MAKPDRTTSGRNGKDKGGSKDDSGGSTRGTRGDDTFIGTAAAELFQGREGIDRLIVSGSVWDFDWDAEWHERGVDWTLTDLTGQSGEDSLSSVEVLQFDDATITMNQDTPMDVLGLPERFTVEEDGTYQFDFVVRDLDDTRVETSLAESGWRANHPYSEIRLQTNYDSPENRYGGNSLQRAITLSYSYVEQEVSLAEGEELVVPVAFTVTTTSKEDFFGETAEESRDFAVDMVIVGRNDAPTISGSAAFETDDLSTGRFDLSLLGDDIDSDDDGASLDYRIVDIDQRHTNYRTPFGIETEGNMLITTPDGLPEGFASDEQSWATVELQAVDRHGAVSEETTTVDLVMQGTATERLRDGLLDAGGEIDLSPVVIAAGEIVDYGTDSVLQMTYDEAATAPMLIYTPDDDTRLIRAGSLGGFNNSADVEVDGVVVAEESRFITGEGADTWIYQGTAPQQQFFALNEISTGRGEDAVVIEMRGAAQVRHYGNDIETGDQSDQVIVHADATANSWFMHNIDTGSGHDVVDLRFDHLAQSGDHELLNTASVDLGSGDDSFRYVVTSHPGVRLAHKANVSVFADAGDDSIHIDIASLAAFPISPEDDPDGVLSNLYTGGLGGSVYLGAGDDEITLALSEPVNGSRNMNIYGEDFGNPTEGHDTLTLANLNAGDVTVGTTMDSYGNEGLLLSTEGGQNLSLYGIDSIVFADGTLLF